jgi:hypothetical protein
MCDKPTIGLKPRWMVDEERFNEVRAAIAGRYMTLGPILIEWIEEYNDLAVRILRRREQEEHGKARP